MYMRTRSLVILALIAAPAGCTSGGNSTDDVDFQIAAPDLQSRLLHIEPTGLATRVTEEHGTQTAVLDPTRLVEVRTAIDNARFPSLLPSYRCTGVCPAILSTVYDVTVEIGVRSFAVETDEFYMRADPPLVPAGLVTAIRTLQDVFDHSDWR
jgi:hypothetical protein